MERTAAAAAGTGTGNSIRVTRTNGIMTRSLLNTVMIGASLGAVILGGGGRLAMRGVTLWEGRSHLFSVGGTITVVIWGIGFGIAAALLRIGIEVIATRWIPSFERARSALWWIITLAIALTLLTPWSPPRLALFPPVIVLFLLAFEISWRRNRATV